MKLEIILAFSSNVSKQIYNNAEWKVGTRSEEMGSDKRGMEKPFDSFPATCSN